jgi:uncharacterized protein (DUF697 family)/tellurite resistance protein
MQPEEQRALLSVALMAAFADGDKSDAERAEIKRITDSLGAQAQGLDVQAALQDVLLQRVTLAQTAAQLQAPALRQLAYELAVCVCDADGAQSLSEKQFLAALKVALGGSVDTAFQSQTAALADMTDAPVPAASLAPAAPTATLAADTTALQAAIRSQAILCGALELLPQSWASMAIIPLQVKLVHRIGTAHGAQLDAGMVKEFIGAAGVGLTGQYLEQFGRKLVGGLLGSVLGGLGRGVGGLGTSMAMSFATTYALGHLALRYYAGGRQMSTALLQQTYQDLLGQARSLQGEVLPQIQQQARTLDAGSVLDLVRRPLT